LWVSKVDFRVAGRRTTPASGASAGWLSGSAPRTGSRFGRRSAAGDDVKPAKFLHKRGGLDLVLDRRRGKLGAAGRREPEAVADLD